MNLTSCNNCGVVLDKKKLDFFKDIYKEDFSVDLTKAVWDSEIRDHVAFVPCPICRTPILENQ